MSTNPSRSSLAEQLAWLIRLRWIAGLIVLAAGTADRLTLRYDSHSIALAAIGVCILAYNVAMRGALARANQQTRLLLRLAVGQMTLDLLCLAIIVGWTGGVDSPVLTLIVVHMVFASLLFPQSLAYLSSLSAIAMLAGALAVTGQLPVRMPEVLKLGGLLLTLILTVRTTSRITRDLRRKRRRLVRQNRRIRALALSLQRHQRAMVRQAKMVALGQMATGVAHEITNPLASMDSLLQLAQRNPDRMNAEFITKLRDQVARINATIHQMRSLAHPAVGEKQQIRLNELVEQAVEMARMDSRARRIGIQKALGGDVGLVAVQPQAIIQVIINLLLNALDATAEVESPKLVVCTRRGQNGYVIEVTDNGAGIQPQHMNRVFEPFFTTKPVGKGTGLGLSISYNLIRRQGGQIDVASTLGVGTTFTIQLPSIPSVSEALPNPAATP